MHKKQERPDLTALARFIKSDPDLAKFIEPESEPPPLEERLPITLQSWLDLLFYLLYWLLLIAFWIGIFFIFLVPHGPWRPGPAWKVEQDYGGYN
jgi:hypothetical protein